MNFRANKSQLNGRYLSFFKIDIINYITTIFMGCYKMHNSNQTKKVTAGIIEKEGKILIAKRADKGCNLGKWEFPGGKAEEGESLQECLKRELFEELGIQAIIGDYICSSLFMHKNQLHELIAFKVISFEGEITLFEHTHIAWIEKNQFHNYDFPDPDKPIIDLLLKT